MEATEKSGIMAIKNRGISAKSRLYFYYSDVPQQQLEMTPLKTEENVPKSQGQQDISVKEQQPDHEPKMDNDTKQVSSLL